MKTFLSVVVLTLLSIGIAAPPARADDKDIQKELEAQYAGMEQAFQKKDVKALEAILAPDFTVTIKTADGWKWQRAEDLGGTTKSGFEKPEKPSSGDK